MDSLQTATQQQAAEEEDILANRITLAVSRQGSLVAARPSSLETVTRQTSDDFVRILSTSGLLDPAFRLDILRLPSNESEGNDKEQMHGLVLAVSLCLSAAP